MKQIDAVLNRVTMYRLVVYVLSFYAALSVVFSFMGRISMSPTSLVLSLALVLVPAYITDRVFGWLFKVPTNMESSLITSLIIFLIVQPAHTTATGLALVLAGIISSASKFLLTWNAKHIFNPAAFAAAVLNLTGLQATTWWVGNTNFWLFTLIIGLLVVRKIRRFPLVISFWVVAIGFQVLQFAANHQLMFTDMKQALIASPFIFLSTIMLTEPATMPPRRNLQVLFGVLVAVFYVTAWKVGPLRIYPEVALLLGNIFAFAVSPKFRVRLKLKEIQKISDRVYNYVFTPDKHFNFLPGQYMEWTLAGVPYDSRGNRRTFTIASSPTEAVVQLGVKFYEPASMYKAQLEQLRPGDIVYGSQLAGNFTLPENDKQKLAFIAGGIGITPFRSMIKYLDDQQQPVDVVLLYVVSDPAEFVYAEDFKAARSAGIKVLPIVSRAGYSAPGVTSGRLSPELIKQTIPDYAERQFYISGPNTMVDGTNKYLHQLGVTNIKTDHFSGY